MQRKRRRSKQLLDELKEMKGYRKLKEYDSGKFLD
jgi:hypothetical protein